MRSAISPVPHPRSATTAFGCSKPSAASHPTRLPKSSLRMMSQSPPTRLKNPLPARRAAITAVRRASSCSRSAARASEACASFQRERTAAGMPSRSTRYRLVVPSTRRCSIFPSKSSFSCRLTVDCGICSARPASPTASSWRDSARRSRTRCGSESNPSTEDHCAIESVSSAPPPAAPVARSRALMRQGPGGSAVAASTATPCACSACTTRGSLAETP